MTLNSVNAMMFRDVSLSSLFNQLSAGQDTSKSADLEGPCFSPVVPDVGSIILQLDFMSVDGSLLKVELHR